jgi:hypothetical protein
MLAAGRGKPPTEARVPRNTATAVLLFAPHTYYPRVSYFFWISILVLVVIGLAWLFGAYETANWFPWSQKPRLVAVQLC